MLNFEILVVSGGTIQALYVEAEMQLCTLRPIMLLYNCTLTCLYILVSGDLLSILTMIRTFDDVKNLFKNSHL